MATRHPLRLVAPWYRWERQRHEHGPWSGPLPRATRPVFQKYVSVADAVKLLLKNPQLSYQFFDDEDRVVVTEASPYTGPIRKLAGRRAIITSVRKLFRDTHQRGYLVVFEMHCDAPGFPDANWSHIGETGFVVRRWVPVDPTRLEREAEQLEEGLAWLRAIELHLDERPPGKYRNPLGSDAPAWTRPYIAYLESHPTDWRLRLHARIAVLRRERVTLEQPDPLSWKLQYWQPDEEHAEIGAWKDFGATDSETPADRKAIKEKIYPLYRLIPDPRDKKHLSLGARILFGSVPTGDMDTTVKGESHIDARDTYEIRCFVQQLKECCAGKPERGVCPDQLRWTARTEPYRIAAHFDPVGTGNVVVRVEMPDLRALAGQPPRGFPIRFQWPSGSKPAVTPGFPPGGSLEPKPMVCTMSIPLVTIVATFLLELITPIVIYLFSLYYLLFARFCFPPGEPAVGKIPSFDGKTMDVEIAKEYSGDERAEFESNFQNVELPTRTGRLVWEPVIAQRPRVDAPQLVRVTA